MYEILLLLEMWGVEWVLGVFYVYVKRIGVFILKFFLDVDMI